MQQLGGCYPPPSAILEDNTFPAIKTDQII